MPARPSEPDRRQILRFCAEDPVERVFLEDVARRGFARFRAVEQAEGSGGRRAELGAHLESAGSLEIGDEIAEILRVEAGRPRFGTDMDSGNLPDEVGMDDAISTTKGCYVGQEVVARLRTYGRVNRRLVSFRFPEGPIGAGEVLRRSDEETPSRTEAGRVTSSVEARSSASVSASTRKPSSWT